MRQKVIRGRGEIEVALISSLLSVAFPATLAQNGSYTRVMAQGAEPAPRRGGQRKVCVIPSSRSLQLPSELGPGCRKEGFLPGLAPCSQSNELPSALASARVHCLH